MQGKILSTQLIISDDGKRYEYDKNDVVNLGNKDLAMLTGSQVDFVIFDERVAKSIYIINENVNVSSILSADSISSARAKALWGIGLLIFGFIILYIGYFFILTPNIRKIIDLGLQFFSFITYIVLIIAIVSVVLYSMAIYSVSKAVASKSLFKNYIKAIIIIFLCDFLMPSMTILASKHVDIFTRMIAVFVLDMIALIVAIYGYKIHAELARLSGSSLFLWSFWINAVNVPLRFVFIIFAGFPSFVIFVGFANIIKFVAFAVSIIYLVLHFIAWWRFKKVEKR
ncbi:MAG: hypothetical protein SPE49_02525 [Campylobacter sp.]|uniref:hypothetical protein n=1 Tax=Campylobacter sp. TaxID=205 RepID=UPI002A833B9A|nr:hypothetical protein [Campylobacter sp.]MCI7586493.1 hypothetical protein [Campylobacter sp.]MDY5114833.1 hypothetical protein [Campylobacter sp.]